MTTIDPSEVHIRMMRGDILGGCPSYAITISGDGQVEYEGHAEVEAIGRRHFEIPQRRILPILDTLFRFRFFDSQGHALTTVGLSPDGRYVIEKLTTTTAPPTLSVTVTFGPFHNTIDSDQLAFPFLEDIATVIEKTVNANELIGKPR